MKTVLLLSAETTQKKLIFSRKKKKHPNPSQWHSHKTNVQSISLTSIDMTYSLLLREPKIHSERSPTDSALVAKSIPNIQVSLYPNKPEERQDFTSIVHAIAMDYDLNDERQQAPRSHRRTRATDWNELFWMVEDPSMRPRHRRCLALTNDEFTEITMLCEELHGPWALHHNGDAAVWDGWKTDGSRL
jgi:hypothetical protein